MNDEKVIEDRILAIFLDAGEVYPVSLARSKYLRVFGEGKDDAQQFAKSLWSLVKSDIIVE